VDGVAGGGSVEDGLSNDINAAARRTAVVDAGDKAPVIAVHDAVLAIGGLAVVASVLASGAAFPVTLLWRHATWPPSTWVGDGVGGGHMVTACTSAPIRRHVARPPSTWGGDGVGGGDVVGGCVGKLGGLGVSGSRDVNPHMGDATETLERDKRSVSDIRRT